jgi:hypothetical protein
MIKFTTMEELSDDPADRRELLGLVDQDHVARQLSSGGELDQREREFLLNLLQGGKLKSRHAASALKADKIVRAVFEQAALEPGKLESSVAAVMRSHRVSRAFVFRALGKLDPRRKDSMKTAAEVRKTWLVDSLHRSAGHRGTNGRRK